MTSGTMPWAASVRMTPIWAKPRAAPPPSASPMVGRVASGLTGRIGVGGTVAVARTREKPLKHQTQSPVVPDRIIEPGLPQDKNLDPTW